MKRRRASDMHRERSAQDDHVPRLVPRTAAAAARLERLLSQLNPELVPTDVVCGWSIERRTQWSARIAFGLPASAHSRSLSGRPFPAGRLVEALPRGFLVGALDRRARSRELGAARGKRR